MADVEVVMGKAAALVSDNTIIGDRGGIFRHGDAEGGSDLQAFENEIDAIGIVAPHAALPAADKILLAHALLGPFDGDAMIAGEGLNPVLVVRSLRISLVITGAPITSRQKWTTCSGRDRPVR
jgi:hypothetical protein